MLYIMNNILLSLALFNVYLHLSKTVCHFKNLEGYFLGDTVIFAQSLLYHYVPLEDKNYSIFKKN